jgi:FAD/FMN-containing dehydrogenase
MSDLLDQFRQICGAAHVLTHEDPTTDLSAWERDWRKRAQGRALAVVRPANVQEVSEVVKACSKANVSIVPQGGNTGLAVGSIPDDSGQQVVLSLQRMNNVRSLDAANLTVIAEAGCILQQVQTHVEQAG